MVWGDIVFWPFSFVWGIVAFVIALIVIIFMAWMLIDCIQRKFKIEAERWIWVVLIILTRGVGAIVYYIAVRVMHPKGIAKK